MKTILSSCTGTGNSHAITGKIAEELIETGLVPVVSPRDAPVGVCPATDRAGILCSPDDAGINVCMAESAGKSNLSAIPRIFTIARFSGVGALALHRISRILVQGCGRKLVAVLSVRMPAVLPPAAGVPPSGTPLEKPGDWWYGRR